MRIMRLPEVEQKCGLRKTAIYGLIGKGAFPRPIQLAANHVGWVESELDDWITSRIAARDECGTERGFNPFSGEINRYVSRS